MKNGRYFAIVRRDEIERLPAGSTIAVKVYLVIRSFAFDRGVVGDLSLSQIAQLVGTARHNVPRALRRLEADGFIIVVRGGPRGHIKNRYLLPAEEDDDETADAATDGLTAETRSGLMADTRSGLTAETRSGLTAETRSGLTAETRSGLTAETRSGLTAENTLERVERKEILREGQARARGPASRKKLPLRQSRLQAGKARCCCRSTASAPATVPAHRPTTLPPGSPQPRPNSGPGKSTASTLPPTRCSAAFGIISRQSVAGRRPIPKRPSRIGSGARRNSPPSTGTARRGVRRAARF